MHVCEVIIRVLVTVSECELTTDIIHVHGYLLLYQTLV